MKYFSKMLILMILFTQSVWTQNELLFFQTNWGFEGSWEAFFLKTKSSGYDGVEVWLPKNARVQQEVSKGLKKHQLKVIYLCGTNKSLSFKESLLAYENDLKKVIVQKPYAINSAFNFR